MWKQANQDLWSVLLLTTSGSASSVVKTAEGKKAEDGTEDEHAAWEALNEKYNNSHTKETKRAYRKKTTNTKMEPGQNHDKLFFVLDGCRDHLEEMGHTVHNERYVDIIWQAFPAEYEGVQNASYENRDFLLVDI